MNQNYKLKLFIRFLKKNHIYNQFFANSTSAKGYHIRKINRRKENIIYFINDELNNQGYVINRAFVWDETEEGYLYWLRIYDEWEQIRHHLYRINY